MVNSRPVVGEGVSVLEETRRVDPGVSGAGSGAGEPGACGDLDGLEGADRLGSAVLLEREVVRG